MQISEADSSHFLAKPLRIFLRRPPPQSGINSKYHKANNFPLFKTDWFRVWVRGRTG